jgi:hypothetical protein
MAMPARLMCVLSTLIALLTLTGGGCETYRRMVYLPPLEEQRALIQNNDIRIHKLSPTAFVETWGPPTHERQEKTAFFVLESGEYVPTFRAPLGEAPPGWKSKVAAGEGRFMLYADRGELLVFLEGALPDERLVYRERLSPQDLDAIVKLWKRDDQFKIRLEKDLQHPH